MSTLAPALQAAAAAMSEDELERQVRTMVRQLRLHAFHVWKLHARRASSGYPDWTIAGVGGVIWRELKREREQPTKAQQEWLDVLAAGGADAGVWRPSDCLSGRIARELAAVAGLGTEAARGER